MRLVIFPAILILFVTLGALRAEEDVTFVTGDGITIHGTYYGPTAANAPGLVLLHMLGKNRHSWDDFAGEALKAGYALLAIDFRGHGESLMGPTGAIKLKSMTGKEFGGMVGDVAVAVGWLRARPEVVDSKIGLVGASIGANLALSYAATDLAITAVVLLSPGEEYRSVQAAPALKAYGHRPVFLVAAEDDNYSLVSVRALDPLAVGPKEVLILPEGGHGTYMLGQQPELTGTVLNFLNAYLR